MRNRNYITSLERGLKILQVFGESSHPLTLTEVANACKLNKTATQRFLYTLCSLEYIHRDPNKSYVLGTKVLSLGFNYFNASTLVKLVKPYLDELSSRFNKTVNLAILDDVETLILYRKEVVKFFKYDIGPGAKFPAHAGCLGKVLLAGLPLKELKKRINKMKLHPVTQKTITSKEMLLEEINGIKKQGYGVSKQELSMDLDSFAVPLVDTKPEVVGVINFSTQAESSSSDDLQVLLDSLLKKGEEISRSLGYTGPYPWFPD